MNYPEPNHHPPRHVRRHLTDLWVRLLEILAVALSFLQRSRIARFLSAKLSMGAVVEVTARFGRSAGHRLSTVLAAIVAEPRLIVIIVIGVILIGELIAWIVRQILRRSRYNKYGRRRRY